MVFSEEFNWIRTGQDYIARFPIALKMDFDMAKSFWWEKAVTKNWMIGFYGRHMPSCAARHQNQARLECVLLENFSGVSLNSQNFVEKAHNPYATPLKFFISTHSIPAWLWFFVHVVVQIWNSRHFFRKLIKTFIGNPTLMVISRPLFCV